MPNPETKPPKTSAEPDNAQKPAFHNLSEAELTALVQKHAKYKKRSEETTLGTHIPELAAATTNQYTTLLIGSSMLERFKTTGRDLKLGLHSHILNLGCGGDTIPNVLYRLSLGVLEKAKGKGEGVRIVIVNIGSNDFKRGRPFSEAQVWEFGVLVEVLRRMGIGARVVATGLFYRKDLERESVDASNAMMKSVVEEMEGVDWLDAPEVSMESAFADHVHLNRKGYEVWDNWLVEKLDL